MRKGDVIIAKNYLSADEIDTLNRLVVIFLETAELRAKNRVDLTLDFWRENVERILSNNDMALLEGKGSVSHGQMETHAKVEYDTFNARRKKQEAEQADAQDLEELRQLGEAARKVEHVSRLFLWLTLQHRGYDILVAYFPARLVYFPVAGV